MTAAQLRDAWPEVLEVLQKSAGRLAWAVVSTTTVHSFDDDVLTLGFTNESDVTSFRPSPGAPAGESVSEQLRSAIAEVLGVRVKFLPRIESAAASQAAVAEPASEPDPPAGRVAAEPRIETPEPEPDPPAGRVAAEPRIEPPEPEPDAAPPEPASGWNVVAIPNAAEPQPDPAPAPESERPASTHPAGDARYGEAVVREILGANFLEETSTASRDRPVTLAGDE